MTLFSVEDTRHISAAKGWLELGNWQEADEELACIQAHLRGDLDVVEVRWQIYAKAGRWQFAEELARVVIEEAPENAQKTMYQLARFACQWNRVEEARHWLMRALEKADEKMKAKALEGRKLEAAWKSQS